MRARHAPDRFSVSLTLGVHGLILVLAVLAWEDLPVAKPEQSALTLFEVAPLPAPPPPFKLPPPKPALAPPGGSPLASARTRERVDPSPRPMASPMPPTVSPVSPFAQDNGPARLDGPGSAINSGLGHGIGTGTGAGVGSGGVHYAKAAWIYQPTLEEMIHHWPRSAIRKRIPGKVELACIVPKPGKPKRCWVLSESPKGFGFGRSAVSLSRLFQIEPVRRDGDPFDLPILVPVVYTVAPLPVPPEL